MDLHHIIKIMEKTHTVHKTQNSLHTQEKLITSNLNRNKR